MDARSSMSPSIRKKAEAPADSAVVPDEAALEAARAQGVEVPPVLVPPAQVLLAEAQVLVLPAAAEVPVGLVSDAAATPLQLHEAVVRPFRA